MITFSSTASSTGLAVRLTLTASDSVNLTNKTLVGTVAWGDGTTTSLSGTYPFSLTISHSYASDGTYLIQTQVSNRKAPKPDSARALVYVTLTHGNVDQTFEPNSVVYVVGPTLSDSKNWCFNIGTGVDVIKSNLALIIMTQSGERLMDGGFGTNNRQIIFEKDTRLVETVLKEEITAAVSKYEPRVTTDSLTVKRESDRVAVLNAIFTMKDGGEQITITQQLSNEA